MADTKSAAAAEWERLTGNPGGSRMSPRELRNLDRQRADYHEETGELQRKRATLLLSGEDADALKAASLQRKILAIKTDWDAIRPVTCDVTLVLAAEIDMLEERAGTDNAHEHDAERLKYLRTSHPAAAVLADSNNPETVGVGPGDVGTFRFDDEDAP